MSLEIRNAPGQPGYALLVFNRELDVGSLKLAIQNRMSRKYLGPSVGKANWSPARSHFFDATLVSCTDGETIFKVGPEAVSFIPDEATIEFTSEDNTICEQAVWSGILLPFHWTVTDASPDTEAEAARERDHRRREREDTERRASEAATQRRRQEVELERQRLETEERQKREDTERRHRDVELRRQSEANAERRRVEAVERQKSENADRERRDLELRRQRDADAERQRVEVEQRRLEEAQDLREREEAGAEARRVAAIEEMARLAREADQGHAANAAVTDDASLAGRQARLRVFAMIATLVVVLFAMLWGSQNQSYLCGRFGAFCAPETMAFDAAVTCAKYKTCGANECIADYRRTYPTGVHKAQIDQIADTKGMACQDGDKASYDTAAACAAAKVCGVGDCVAGYRMNYPLGRFKTQIDQIVQSKGLACQDMEKASFDRASACAASRTCGADECVADHRRNYPAGRFKAQIDGIVQTKGQACWDAEQSNFDVASTCVASRTCGAEECRADYQRLHPSGRYKAQLDQLIALKVQACADFERLFDKGRGSKERRR